MTNNYSSAQLDRLVNEIEGRLNDFENGITEKDETIKSFVNLVYDCAENAVKNYEPELKGTHQTVPEITDLRQTPITLDKEI